MAADSCADSSLTLACTLAPPSGSTRLLLASSASCLLRPSCRALTRLACLCMRDRGGISDCKVVPPFLHSSRQQHVRDPLTAG